MSIGQRIKKVRNEKKISIRKLTELSGLSKSTISEIENDIHGNPTQNTMQKIADALEVSIDKLTGASVSSIIEEQIKVLGMTLEELSDRTEISGDPRSKVPLHWLQTIDSFIPGEWGAENDIAYKWITRVAEVIGLHGSLLRAALARQEIPVYDGQRSDPKEDFMVAETKTQYILSANCLDDYNNELPPEALEELKNFIEYLKVKYKKR